MNQITAFNQKSDMSTTKNLFTVTAVVAVLLVQSQGELPRNASNLEQDQYKIKGSQDDETRSPSIFNADGAASPGQFPFYARVNVDQFYVAGGTLISPEWVLTAATNVDSYYSWTIVLGAVNTSAIEPGTVSMWTSEAYMHPQYSIFRFPNYNIAVIKLPEPVSENGLQQQNSSFAGENVIVSGFGFVGEDGPLSDELLYANMEVMTNPDCGPYYGPDILDSVLCATGPGNICAGDVGGPLVLSASADGLYTVIGITAFQTNSSCELGTPAGFTRITSYLDWIVNMTQITLQP